MSVGFFFARRPPESSQSGKSAKIEQRVIWLPMSQERLPRIGAGYSSIGNCIAWLLSHSEHKNPLLIMRNSRCLFPAFLLGLILFARPLLAADAVGDYRSVATGAWNGATTWETCTVAGNPGTWAATSTAPTASSGVITIRLGHTVTTSTAPLPRAIHGQDLFPFPFVSIRVNSCLSDFSSSGGLLKVRNPGEAQNLGIP